MESPGASYPINPNEGNIRNKGIALKKDKNGDDILPPPLTVEQMHALEAESLAQQFRQFEDKDRVISNSKVSRETMLEAENLLKNLKGVKGGGIKSLFGLGGVGNLSNTLTNPTLSYKKEKIVMAIDALFLKLWSGHSGLGLQSINNSYSASAVSETLGELMVPSPSSAQHTKAIYRQYLQYSSGTPSFDIRVIEKSAANLQMLIDAIESSGDVVGGNVDLSRQAADTAESLFPRSADGKNRKNQNNSAQSRDLAMSADFAALSAALSAIKTAGVVCPSFSETGALLFPAARDKYLLLVNGVKGFTAAELRQHEALEDARNGAKVDGSGLGKAGVTGLPENLRPENRAIYTYTDPLQEFIAFIKSKSRNVALLPSLEKLTAAVDKTAAEENLAIFGSAQIDDPDNLLRENLSEERWSFITLYTRLWENIQKEFDGYFGQKKSSNSSNTSAASQKQASGSVSDDDDDEAALIEEGRAIAFINSIGKDYYSGMRWGFVAFIMIAAVARRRLIRDEQRKAFLFCQRMCEREVREALLKSSAATIAANATAVAAAAEIAIASTIAKNKKNSSAADDAAKNNHDDDDDHILTEPTPGDPYYMHDMDDYGDEGRKGRINVEGAMAEAADMALVERRKIREELLMSAAATTTTVLNAATPTTTPTPPTTTSNVFYRKMLVHHAHWMFAVADPNPKKERGVVHTLMKLTSGTGSQLLLNANTGFMLTAGAMSTPATQALIEDLHVAQIESSKRIAKEGLLMVTSGESAAEKKLLGESTTTRALGGATAGLEKIVAATAETAEGSVGEGKEDSTADGSGESAAKTEKTPAASALSVMLGTNGSALLDLSRHQSTTTTADALPPLIPTIPLAIVQQQMLLMLQHSTPLEVSAKTLHKIDIDDGELEKKNMQQHESEMNPTAASASLLFGEDMSVLAKHGGDAAPLSTRVQEHLALFLQQTCNNPLIVVEDEKEKQRHEMLMKMQKNNTKKSTDDEKEKELFKGRIGTMLEKDFPLSVVEGSTALTRMTRAVRRKYFNMKRKALLSVAGAFGSSRAHLESNKLFLMPSVLWHRVLRRSKLIHYNTDVKELKSEDGDIEGGSNSNKGRDLTQRSSIFAKDRKFYYNTNRGTHMNYVDLFFAPFVRPIRDAITGFQKITQFEINPLKGVFKVKPRVIKEEDVLNESDTDDFYSKTRQKQARMMHERANQRRIAAQEEAEEAKRKQQQLLLDQQEMLLLAQQQQQQIAGGGGGETNKADANVDESAAVAMADKTLATTPASSKDNGDDGEAQHHPLTTQALNDSKYNAAYDPLSEPSFVARLRQLATLQLRYGYFCLSLKDRLRWKKLIWDVARKGVPQQEDYYNNKPFASRPFMGIPFNLLLAQIALPILIILAILKFLVAHQRYHEILADENNLLELYNEANTIAEAFEGAQQAQKHLIERSSTHFDLDEILAVVKARQFIKGMGIYRSKMVAKTAADGGGGNESAGGSGDNNGDGDGAEDDGVNPHVTSGRVGGGDAFTSSSTHLFKTNAVNPPSSLPAIGIIVPNDYHNEHLVARLDPSAIYTTEVSERAKRHLEGTNATAGFPVLGSSEMTLLSKAQQVELLQYALRNAGAGAGGGGGAGVTVNIDTHRLLAPDFDAESTTDFVISDVMLTWRDGFLTALCTSPSLVEVAQPKFAPAWLVAGVMQSVFTHV